MRVFYLGLGVLIFGVFGCAIEQKQLAPAQKLKVIKRVTIGEPIAKNSFQDKSNWEGYYHGKLPCDGCLGIETWLHLKRVDGRGAYVLREKFLGVKNRYSKGGLSWEDNGKIAKLMSNRNKRVFLKGDNKATFLDEKETSLKKVEVFHGQNSVFLLDSSSIRKGSTKGKKMLKFAGITNYDFLTNEGYKSVRASYLVGCKTKDYTMSRVAHYKGIFAMRGSVAPMQRFEGDRQVIEDVSKKYCK